MVGQESDGDGKNEKRRKEESCGTSMNRSFGSFYVVAWTRIDLILCIHCVVRGGEIFCARLVLMEE